jgi:Tol biopolymer transport system component
MGMSDQFSRLDAPWNLYLMDPDIPRPRKILEGIVDAYGLDWSPDDRWLAFAGEIRGRDGAWLYAPSTGRLVQISAGMLFPLGWSPDGKRILGRVPLSEPRLGESELVILDVGTMTSDR